ncbi:hypothetical protein GGX14DRAFT_579794 [Mycena pura]|uniref:Uncharacterized protein n=1 Tax=Mycena pura TaxID=153505 RepID=A0AAD6XYA6_9AGAR|nr:hypothetical protein GGX14DRAFT_579794 [Mycena pura]
MPRLATANSRGPMTSSSRVGIANGQQKKCVEPDTNTSDLDLEQSSAHAKSAPRRHRRRRNRKQRKRGIMNVAAHRQQLVKAAYEHVNRYITMVHPFPTASPSGDADADDDQIENLILDAWDYACRKLGLDPEMVEDPMDKEKEL